MLARFGSKPATTEYDDSGLVVEGDGGSAALVESLRRWAGF
jgi:hypothetical protein